MKDQARSERAKEIWSRPGYRDKMKSAISKGGKKRWSSKENKEHSRKYRFDENIVRVFMEHYSTDEREAYSYLKLAMLEYGLKPEELLALYKRANFVCECCKRHAKSFGHDKGWNGTKAKLCIDHDKETGHVRGLLCHSCNVALGLMNHNVAACFALGEYLKMNSNDSDAQKVVDSKDADGK